MFARSPPAGARALVCTRYEIGCSEPAGRRRTPLCWPSFGWGATRCVREDARHLMPRALDLISGGRRGPRAPERPPLAKPPLPFARPPPSLSVPLSPPVLSLSPPVLPLFRPAEPLSRLAEALSRPAEALSPPEGRCHGDGTAHCGCNAPGSARSSTGRRAQGSAGAAQTLSRTAQQSAGQGKSRGWAPQWPGRRLRCPAGRAQPRRPAHERTNERVRTPGSLALPPAGGRRPASVPAWLSRAYRCRLIGLQ